MIDWVTAILPCKHKPIPSGSLLKIAQNGCIEWESPSITSVTGSFDARISVKSEGAAGDGMASHLWFSGNPAKFLQGHNVFGSDDLVGLVYRSFLLIAEALAISVHIDDATAIRDGNYTLSRVDITYSWELPTRSDVLAWLHAAEYKSRTRRGRAMLRGDTLYWNCSGAKASRRWNMKAYSKGQEIHAGKGHQLPAELRDSGLAEWAENKLRLELLLRGMEMKDLGINKASDFNESRCRTLHAAYLERIGMNAQLTLKDEAVDDLPRSLQNTYLRWSRGHDVRKNKSRSCFYRHRKGLLKYGIDIAIPCDTDNVKNVIPLVRVLEARPAEIPEWAYRKRLVFQSSHIKKSA